MAEVRSLLACDTVGGVTAASILKDSHMAVYLRLLDPEHEGTVILQNIGSCNLSDHVTSQKT